MSRLAAALHHYFLLLLLASYALAGFAPQFGLALRSLHAGAVNLPSLLLALLLFNAGVGTNFASFLRWREDTTALATATIANICLPILFLWGGSFLLQYWHNNDEVQNVLTGLALVGSMPIAGSSTAWAQNASGNVGISLLLVLISTLVSPAVTPTFLRIAGGLTLGDYREDLQELASSSAGHFLLFFVLAPSLAGIVLRGLRPNLMSEELRSTIKVINSITLLLLCYMNAAVSLPHALHQPDWDFLSLVLLVTLTYSLCSFLAGLGLARLLRVSKDKEVSLTFGLGMSNNGTGLVIAASAMPDHPFVLLPILFINLLQHLMAGLVDRVLFSRKE